MRADAEIDEIALAVEADVLVAWNFADILGLVLLANAGEERDRLVALPHLAGDRLVAFDDVAHALLDARQIIRRERRIAGEVVVEARLGGGAKGDLSLGVQLLDRFGHHVRRVVAQDVDALRRARGDDRDVGVMVDLWSSRSRGAAVDLDRKRRLGEARAD